MAGGTGAGSAKLWAGRFDTPPDARLEAFNASIMFDRRMAREDIRGSVAHVRMLGHQGIVAPEEAATLERGLWQILDEVNADAFAVSISDEDIHTAVERRLREIVGDVGRKLHTGRSRNDQTATDYRLWTKDAIVSLMAGVIELVEALLDVAEAHPGTVMPGYTHLQRAQPVLLAHHLHAYVEMLLRDLDRLLDAHRRTDVSPLGAGALAGTTFPIDRAMTAADLGFGEISGNSLDAVGDRDYVLDTLFACALIAMHLSRLSEEIILWSTGEFRFVELSDTFSTGSSIMPQKKNPDVAELARGKTGRVYGHLVGMLTVAKGLPLTYNKDFQEDKENLFDAVDTTLAILDVFPPMLRTARFNTERLAEAAVGGFSLATDAADLLARNGVAFREAHETVARLVSRCIAEGKEFADLSDAEWAEVHPVFAETRPPLSALESVSARDILGGTAPGRVAQALANARAQIAEEAAWVAGQRAARERLLTPPRQDEP